MDQLPKKELTIPHLRAHIDGSAFSTYDAEGIDHIAGAFRLAVLGMALALYEPHNVIKAETKKRTALNMLSFAWTEHRREVDREWIRSHSRGEPETITARQVVGALQREYEKLMGDFWEKQLKKGAELERKLKEMEGRIDGGKDGGKNDKKDGGEDGDEGEYDFEEQEARNEELGLEYEVDEGEYEGEEYEGEKYEGKAYEGEKDEDENDEWETKSETSGEGSKVVKEKDNDSGRDEDGKAENIALGKRADNAKGDDNDGAAVAVESENMALGNRSEGVEANNDDKDENVDEEAENMALGNGSEGVEGKHDEEYEDAYEEAEIVTRLWERDVRLLRETL